MRRWLLLQSALSLILAMPSGIVAQNDPKAPVRDAGSLFEQLDSNKDGTISKDEVPEGRQRLFTRLVNQADKNQDGKLSREEFTAGLNDGPSGRAAAEEQRRPEGKADQPLPRAGQLGPAFFERLDANQDGKITKDEIPEGQRERITVLFGRLDKDGDGTITKEEFNAARTIAPRPDAAPASDGARSPMALFRALDTDGDGQLSSAEIENAAAALKNLDKNGDGRLSRDEIGIAPATGGVGGAGRFPPAMFERLRELDKNNDGKWSKDELPPRLQERFDSLDKNNNGFLDRAEIREGMPRGGPRGGPERAQQRGAPGRSNGRSNDSDRPEPKKDN